MTDLSPLILPEDFHDYAWEVESKGYFASAIFKIGQQIYPVSFVSPTRLAQDVQEDVSAAGYFHEPNLIVIPVVTIVHMENVARTFRDNPPLAARLIGRTG